MTFAELRRMCEAAWSKPHGFVCINLTSEKKIQPWQEVFAVIYVFFVLKEMQKGKQLQEMINIFWCYDKYDSR